MRKEELFQKLSACWVSCMVMMVEGNLLALNAKHCIVALKSSIGALVLFGFTNIFIRNKTLTPIQESALLAVSMAAIDVTVHPTHFGAWWTEAVATGIAAGVLNYGVTLLSQTKKL
jgi:uncharacterized membrane protein